MKKHAIAVLVAFALSLSITALALGQTQTQTQMPTTKTVVQNADGTYTVIEIPAGKEIQVTLDPSSPTAGTGLATGFAGASAGFSESSAFGSFCPTAL